MRFEHFSNITFIDFMKSDTFYKICCFILPLICIVSITWLAVDALPIHCDINNDVGLVAGTHMFMLTWVAVGDGERFPDCILYLPSKYFLRILLS